MEQIHHYNNNYTLNRSATIGATYIDTKLFDDSKVIKRFASLKDNELNRSNNNNNKNSNNSNNMTISAISISYGNYIPEGCINGIKIYYKNLNTMKEYTPGYHLGTHNLIGEKVFLLMNDEFIIKTIVYFYKVITRIGFYTNRGNSFEVGSKKGEFMIYDFTQNNEYLHSIFGGVGGHLHFIGFTSCERTNSDNILIKQPRIDRYTLLKSMLIGSKYKDTKSFDDLEEYEIFTKSLLSCRISSIKIWSSWFNSGSINGLQISYTDMSTNKKNEFKMLPRTGQDHVMEEKEYTLEEDEKIIKVIIKEDGIITRLEFHTSNNRKFIAGGNKGNQYVLDFQKKNTFLIGIYGGYGGHLHNIGFYMIDPTYIKYLKKREYILMKVKLLSNYDILEQLVHQNNEQTTAGGIDPALAFARLVLLNHDQIFKKVISYVN